MAAVIERTITVDSLLAQRADAKLRQYGWSMDQMIARTLLALVSVSGEPESVFVVHPRPTKSRRPGALKGRIEIADDFDESSNEIADLFEKSSV